MEFDTIQQYFYKLHSLLLLILLFSLLIFIGVYLLPAQVPQPIQQHPDLFMQVAGIVVLLWMVVFIFTAKKIKSIPNDQGLRVKLEKYYGLTIVRYSLSLFISLALAVGFFITRYDMFTLLYMINLFILGVLWPTTGRVCKDLKLRGDEREMVYHKKEDL